MKKRMLGAMVSCLLVVSVGTANAGLADDAKAVLQQLLNLGDYGQAAAESGLTDTKKFLDARLADATAGATRLAVVAKENRDLAASLPHLAGSSTPIGLSGAPSTADIAAATRSLDAAGVAWGATTAPAGIARSVAGRLRSRADSAATVLRALFPAPLGTRPPMKTVTATNSQTGISVSSQVPNDPPSDDDLRSAIGLGKAALQDVANAPSFASSEFFAAAGGRMKEWMQAYSALGKLLGKERHALVLLERDRQRATATVPASAAKKPVVPRVR